MLKFILNLPSNYLRISLRHSIKKMSEASVANNSVEVISKGTKRSIDEVSPEIKRIKRRKFAVLISYSGQGYFGLQRNPGTKTIEDDLLSVLHKVGLITDEGLNQPQSFQFQRAARTDKGVSAVRQVLSARLPEEFDLNEINNLLPGQIRVMGIKRVTKGFNCKMNCDARTYSYTMPSFALAPTELFKIQNETSKLPEGSENTAIIECNGGSKEQNKDVNSQSHSEDASENHKENEIDYSALCNYRVSPEVIQRANKVLKNFLGTRNYHNFTSRRKPLDPSCQRYIISFTCSDPIMYEGMEFITLKVKGQSFMLHQIRKMVGLTIAILKGLTGEDVLSKCWDKQRIDVPIAPGLGLVLEEVHYDRYNKRYGQDGMHEPVEWSHLSEELEQFKNKFILSTILKTEKLQLSMFNWLKTLEQHTFDVRESGPPADKKEAKSEENGYLSD